jgi:hypothetical protein
MYEGAQRAPPSGLRDAANRKYLRAAFRAKALPAGTTVWKRHLVGLFDCDLLAARAPACWAGDLFVYWSFHRASIGFALDSLEVAAGIPKSPC